MPSDILDSFAIDGTYGSNLNYSPSYEKWVSLKNGTYSSLIITFVDERYNPISMLDSNVNITLLINQKQNMQNK